MSAKRRQIRTSRAAEFAEPGKASATAFLTAALDIEDSQCVLSCWIFNGNFKYNLQVKIAALGTTPTSTQQADIVESRMALQKRILAFRTAQTAFTPEATPLHGQDDLETPEHSTLQLPSHLVVAAMLSPNSQYLAKMEARLRHAQAADSLNGLRRSLAIRLELSKYKAAEVRGQHANTRARTLLTNAEGKLLYMPLDTVVPVRHTYLLLVQELGKLRSSLS